MTKKIVFLLCTLIHLFAFAQKDSIFIDAELIEGNLLQVNQKIIYHNSSEKELHQIKLLNFISAYKNRNTPLVRRKLEDRKTDLYFAKNEDLGAIKLLQIFSENNGNFNLSTEENTTENIFLKLKNSLLPNKSITLNLTYLLQLPNAKFTGYGTEKDKVSLKYFFIVPDSFDKENNTEKHFVDLEENYNIDTYYNVKFTNTEKKISSNLHQITSNTFEGFLKKEVEFYISEKENYSFTTSIENQNHLVEFGFPVSEEDRNYLEFYLPLQLKFIKNKLGSLPEKILISEKSRNKNDFFGNNDIQFWKFKLQLFSNAEKIDLDYISIISQEIADQLFLSEKNNNHWITNGIKTYIEMQYLEHFYPNHLLLGNLSKQISIFGLKPIQLTYASKLKLIERYGLPYQYIMIQNLDQKIDENYQDLSNFNEFAVSKFETGTLFRFIAEKMGTISFDNFIREYINKNKNQFLDKKDFLDNLTVQSGYSADFLEHYVQHKNRVNFSIKSFHRNKEELQIKIAKNTALNIPFKLETINSEGKKSTYWYDTNTKENPYTYIVKDNNTHKMIVNNEFSFPEANFRDNYLYTKGIFSNTKKIKIKWFTDIPNPEYNEIYLAPKLNYNFYDKFLIGFRIQNKSLFDRRFLYSLMPFYSTGTQKLTGSLGASYKVMPPESFFRSLIFAANTSYFHYDKDLSYKKLSLISGINLAKNPRSQINRSFNVSYNYFERELSKTMLLNNDYAKYNLWNFGFIYSEDKVITEKSIVSNFQLMDDYQKITAEAFYRWQYAQNKRFSVRFFGGFFINNSTRNKTFDIGISRVSNYAFSYNLLGQSANTGILSQQYILAEGGFKSLFNNTANQWLSSVNVDTQLWKMFNLYADAGLFKNRNQNTKFIWDSGIKLRLIPDFLEIYLPVQSSLGFEPSFKDYPQRIRYMLTFNLGSVIGYFRRGWY